MASPVVKPACGDASHCIGVRALSRLIARMRSSTSRRVVPGRDALGVVVDGLDVAEVVDPANGKFVIPSSSPW